MNTVIPGQMLSSIASQFPDGHLDCHWEEPASDRGDKWPPLIRRQSWLIQNSTTGLYYCNGSDLWVAQPEKAFSCMWFERAAELVRSAPEFFGPVSDLQLVLLTFYCDPKTFPHGWFCDE